MIFRLYSLKSSLFCFTLTVLFNFYKNVLVVYMRFIIFFNILFLTCLDTFSYTENWRPINLRVDCQTISVGDGTFGFGINLKTENKFSYYLRIALTPSSIWKIVDPKIQVYTLNYNNQQTNSLKPVSSTFGLSGQIHYYFIEKRVQPYLYTGISAGEMYFGPLSLPDKPGYVEGIMTSLNVGLGIEYQNFKRLAFFMELGGAYPFGMKTKLYFSNKHFDMPLFPALKLGISFH